MPPPSAKTRAPRKAAAKKVAPPPHGGTKVAPAKKATPRKANNPHSSPVAEDVAVRTPRKKANATKRPNPLKLAGTVVMSVGELEAAVRDLPSDAELAQMVHEAEQLVRNPAVEAYDLKNAGLTWSQVAERTQYNSPEAAAQAVFMLLQQDALARNSEIVRYAQQMHLDRIEATIVPFWPLMQAGDLDAAKHVLKALESSAKVQGIDKVKSSETRTIIITDGAGMAEELRAAALAAHPNLHVDGRVIDG